MDIVKIYEMPETLDTIDRINQLGLAIVIPALEEANSIGPVLDEVNEVFVNCKKLEVVVVDGHSTDGTDVIAKEKGAKVIYQRNVGYGDALCFGFNNVLEDSEAEVIVMMDADSTYNAWEAPLLIEPIIRDEADMVLGNRFANMQKGSMSFTNRFGNSLISWFARRTLKIGVHDTQSGFRAFRSDLIDRIELEADGMPLAIEMLVKAKLAGARIGEVPISYRTRIGETKLDPLKDGFKIISTIIRLMRDTQPFAFFGAISAILGIVGLALGIEVGLEWLTTGTINRLPTVMLSVLFTVGAVQFFSVGLIADMIKNLNRKRSRV